MTVKSPFLDRLSFRYPNAREAREALKYMVWSVAAQLFAEGLPMPSDEELEALTVRWVELGIIIAGNPCNRQFPERGRAFLREFLHLACTPAPTNASVESTDRESGPGDLALALTAHTGSATPR